MTNKLTLIIALFCASLNAHAQNASSGELDSLINWLELHSQFSKDSSSIYKNAHVALKLSRASSREKSLANSYRYLSNYHKDYAQIDSSLYYLKLVKDIHEISADNNALAETLLELKTLHNLKAEYNESMSSVYDALDIYESIDNQKGIAICYAHICDLLYYENRYQEGINYCDKAIEIQKQLKLDQDLALSYRYKAASQLFSGADLNDALTNINKSISIYKENGETGILNMTAINWRGNILKYLERYDEAITDYQYNFDTSKQLGIERYVIPSIANIGHVYILQSRYREALPYNLQAIDLIKKSGRTRNLWENYMHVSDIYKAMGKYEKALEYYQLYATDYDNYQETIVQTMESEAQIKYETGKMNATIYFQDEKIAQQKQLQILYIGIAVLLAIFLGHFYFSIKSIRKKRLALIELNKELDAKNNQNEILLKEIHHRVKNNLEMVKSLIALQSAKLEDSVSKDAMLSSQNRVQSMGIIHQKLYQGENLGSIEMKDYFINLGEGILDTFNAEEKVKIECAMDNLELDVDTAVPIGLIVNELLTNSLKYAFPENQKGNIKISLSQADSETLTLKVTDNGVGKIKGLAPRGTGFGSQLIKLLTQQLNGDMVETIDNGTSVLFQFKLNSAA